MRILQLHCNSIEYTPTKKEIPSAEDIDPQPHKLDEVVVTFVAIEEGDDSSVAKKAIDEIKESMNKIGCNVNNPLAGLCRRSSMRPDSLSRDNRNMTI